MSQAPDEDEDQIFSGKALGDDGALRPATPIPLRNEIPTLHEGSLIHDPAYEPTVVSPSRVPSPIPPARVERVELAERPPPPMASDFTPPPPETPPRIPNPDIAWGRWLFRGLVLGAVVVGLWLVVNGRLPAWKGLSLDFLRSGEPKQEPKQEKRVGTPAPTLLVLSDPPGATVLVGGTEVGVTPWAGDNVWPREPLRIEVRKPGYRPWVGLAMGGQQATLSANLHRR